MFENKSKLKYFKYILILASIIILGAVVKFSFFQPKPNIAVDYIAKFNELTKPSNYDPAQNSLEPLNRAFEVFNEMPDDLGISWLEYENHNYLMPGDLEEEELERLTEWIDSNEEAIELALKASRKQYYWYECGPDGVLMYSSYPETFNISELSEAIEWKVKCIVENDPSSILLFRDKFRLSDQLLDSGALTESLISHSIGTSSCSTIRNILSHFEIESEILAQLQQYIENNSPAISMDKQFETERYAVLDILQRIYTDDGNGDGHIITDQYYLLFEDTKTDTFGSAFNSGNGSILNQIGDFVRDFYDNIEWERDVVETSESRKEAVDNVNAAFDCAKKLAFIAPYQLREQGTAYEDKINENCDICDDYPVSSLLLPTFRWFLVIPYTSRCEYSATAAILAITRYKQDKGSLPESLKELVDTGYLKQLPIDPYSGKQLIYKLTVDDFQLYSLRGDFDDDNGKDSTPLSKGDDDYVFWPVPRPKKKEPEPIQMIPGMMPGMMPGMSGPNVLEI